MASKIDEQLIALKQSGQYTWSQIAKQTGITKEAARSKYRRLIASQPDTTETQIEIIGETPDKPAVPIQELWERYIQAQDIVESETKRRNHQQRVIIEPPCGIALLSDCHFGSSKTDYKSLKADAELIANTPGMFAGFHGDGVDNWIVGKLAGLQRSQVFDFDSEWQLFFSWLEMLKNKWAWIVAGNHENWTYKMAGVDRVREALLKTKLLYHPHQVFFTLDLGVRQYKILVRHKWKYNSIYNPTHPIEVGWLRLGVDFDIGIGGHTHIGTFCRDFVRHGKRRHAILTGTYKINGDEFGVEHGLTPPTDRGCGAMVFDKNGEMHFEQNLQKAVSYLRFLQNE